jgi:pimeloyl-ACP methyl ester carboxylesterase
MKDLWVDTPYGKVYGKTAGQGPFVLGLHGWSQRNGWHTWEPLLEPLAAAGFRAVSVDMPGWGRSDPLPGGKITPERAVAVVVALLDALGAGTAALMGKSWGGGVALQAALDHPDRVARLILSAPAFRNPGRLHELTQPVLLAWATDDDVIPIRYARAYVEQVPDIHLETYETGGHSAAPKNAADFAPKAIEFLREERSEIGERSHDQS